jgi:hypothetical protein
MCEESDRMEYGGLPVKLEKAAECDSRTGSACGFGDEDKCDLKNKIKIFLHFLNVLVDNFYCN